MPRANSHSRAGQGAQDLHPADDPSRSSLSITALSTPVRGMIRPRPTVVPVTDPVPRRWFAVKDRVNTAVIMRIMTSRIAVIAIDAQQPRVVADFWCAVLGWEVIEVDQDGVSIAPPDRAWPAIDVFACRNAKRSRIDCTWTCAPTAAARIRSCNACSASALSPSTSAKAPT